MRLSDLADCELEEDVDIKGMTADSREVKPGWLFAALKGVHADGTKFIPQAERAGAAAILSGVNVRTPLPLIVDQEPRRRLALMASRFFPRHPSFLAGITGTNGKTSTAHFAAQLWAHVAFALNSTKEQGHRQASKPELGGALGTLGVDIFQIEGGALDLAHHFALKHTTPDPIALHQALDQAAKCGCTHLAMEVSSHGLAQYRADGIDFDVAAFTNITQDHLDYHPTFTDYFSAKKRLFTDRLKSKGVIIVNADGNGQEEIVDLAMARGHNLITTGRNGTDFHIAKLTPVATGLDVDLVHMGESYVLHLPLIGAFQAENALIALAIVVASGFPANSAIAVLEKLQGVPGRMMRAADYKGAGIFVDYAHTPDAIETVIEAARAHTRGQLIAIVGAGGDRDQSKRSLMGLAGSRADQLIITDDNPRGEDPAVIRQMVFDGVPEEKRQQTVMVGDRRDAICKGIEHLQSGDLLLVLGKGHEQGQIVGDRVLPFDDVAVVRETVETWEIR